MAAASRLIIVCGTALLRIAEPFCIVARLSAVVLGCRIGPPQWGERQTRLLVRAARSA